VTTRGRSKRSIEPVTTRSSVGTLVREVEARLVELARKIPLAQAERLRVYHGSNLPHLGLSVPVQRRALREGYSFSAHLFEEQLPIWDAVWRGGRYHETKAQALYYGAARRKPADLIQLWPVVRDWIEPVDCWDSSDELSSIYARILEVDSVTDEVYAVLRTWNQSPNPWKRRQSILSLLYYARSRQSVLPSRKIFPLIQALLLDADRFVQKAVGWSLRETLTPYPDEALTFIRRHARDLSSTAFAEATRKLPPGQRAEIVGHRRATPQKKASARE
jgi:3-methyladenine DNA glycosylase AlkD